MTQIDRTRLQAQLEEERATYATRSPRSRELYEQAITSSAGCR